MDPIHVVRLEIKSWNPYCSKCCWKGGRCGDEIILGAGSYTAPICRLLQCESSRRSSQTLIRSNAHTLPYQCQVGDAGKSAWHILFEVIAVHSHIHSHLVHCLGIWNQHKIIMSRAGLSTLVSQAGELKALPRLSSITPAFRSLCPASRPVSGAPGGKPCPSKKGHSGSQRALSQTGGPKMLLIM